MKIQLHMFMLLTTLLCVSGLLFYPFFLKLNVYWDTDPESKYVFLIPLFSAYFIWVQKEKFKNLQFNRYDISFSKSGLILLICSLSLFIIGEYIYILFIQGLAFIVIIAASILFLYGKGLFKITLIPILFLLFMMPIPFPATYAVTNPLKYFIAYMATSLISLFNAPVLLEGNVIHLPSMSLLVHESCSGMRTIISVLAVSSAFAYLFLKSFHYRYALIIVSIPIGIFVNVLRIALIGILSFFYDSNVAMSFHEHAWGLVAPAGIFTTFLIGNIFRCYEQSRDT